MGLINKVGSSKKVLHSDYMKHNATMITGINTATKMDKNLLQQILKMGMILPTARAMTLDSMQGKVKAIVKAIALDTMRRKTSINGLLL